MFYEKGKENGREKIFAIYVINNGNIQNMKSSTKQLKKSQTKNKQGNYQKNKNDQLRFEMMFKCTSNQEKQQ